jgi:hypothetical protein
LIKISRLFKYCIKFEFIKFLNQLIMKKIFTSVFFISAFAAASFAQCTPFSTTPAGTLYPTVDNLPCIIPGQAYSETVSFKIPAAVTVPQSADIDSVEFALIGNLPCGITATLNKASKRYKGDEIGCFQLTGTTNDAVGQYKLDIQFLAWLTGTTTPVGPVSSELANLVYYVRVKDGANCPNVNTTDPGNTAATNCPTGITEASREIKGMRIQPNPMNQSSIISFDSDKSGAYIVNTVDMVGKVVNSFAANVSAGLNSINIERNDLPQGIYFINITNGKSFATQKFVIAD